MPIMGAQIVDDNGYVIGLVDEKQGAEKPAECGSEIREYYESNLKELRDQREGVFAELSDLYSSDEYAGSSIENRAKMENRDEIRDLKMKLWAIRRRSLILHDAAKYIPADHSAAVKYFEGVKRGAEKRLTLGIPMESTPKEITEFLAAGIEIDVAGDMLEALTAEWME